MEIQELDIVRKINCLGILEFGELPFTPKRLYWLYGVGNDHDRGNHAHKNLQQYMWAIRGSVNLEISDGTTITKVQITAGGSGMYIKPGLWRVLSNFSSDSIVAVLADRPYDESDYIRSWKTFVNWKQNAK